MSLTTFIVALLDAFGSGNANFASAGRKGPVDDRDLWYFERGWNACEAAADEDLRHGRYLDFADPASLVTVLNASPGKPQSHPFVNAIRVANA